MRRAAAEKGMPELESTNLKVAFLTHLHSDHTAGFRVYSSLKWFRFL